MEEALAAFIAGRACPVSCESDANIFKEIAELYSPKDKNDYKALYALYPDTMFSDRRSIIASSIDMSFIWQSTSEGSDFWGDLYDLLVGDRKKLTLEERAEAICIALVKEHDTEERLRFRPSFALDVLCRLLDSEQPIRTTYPLLKFHFMRLANHVHYIFPLGAQDGTEYRNVDGYK